MEFQATVEGNDSTCQRAARGRVRTSASAWRFWLGAAIFAAGASLCCYGILGEAGAWWALQSNSVRSAGFAGTLAAAATAVGTLPILVFRTTGVARMTAMLAVSAGVMLSASLFSLVVPAYGVSRALGSGAVAACMTCLLAAVGGVSLLLMCDRAAERLSWFAASSRLAAADAQRPGLRHAWLFVVAIVLHNVPEGLSIGIGFAGIDEAHAGALAMAICLQDLPEGLVVAMALRTVGYGVGPAAFAGMASGLVEPIAAVASALMVGSSLAALPWALAGAGGAMLFAIAHGMGPRLRGCQHPKLAAALFLAGFLLMSWLDRFSSASS